MPASFLLFKNKSCDLFELSCACTHISYLKKKQKHVAILFLSPHVFLFFWLLGLHGMCHTFRLKLHINMSVVVALINEAYLKFPSTTEIPNMEELVISRLILRPGQNATAHFDRRDLTVNYEKPHVLQIEFNNICRLYNIWKLMSSSHDWQTARCACPIYGRNHIFWGEN